MFKKRILKIFSVYAVCCFVIGVVFSVAYRVLGADEPFARLLIFALSKTLCCDVGSVANTSYGISSAIIVNTFLGQILFTVMTSYSISALLTLSKKSLLLSDKLIVRKRTSPGSENDLTISVMVGNKSKYNLYDVRCEMTCIFCKSEDENDTNKDSYASVTSLEIINFYRYSFTIDALPGRFWESFLSQSGVNYRHAAIEIRVTGKSDMFDNEISVKKKYNIPDIIIANGTKDVFADSKGKNPMKKKPNWININVIDNYTEEKCEIVRKEIEEYVSASKEKATVSSTSE